MKNAKIFSILLVFVIQSTAAASSFSNEAFQKNLEYFKISVFEKNLSFEWQITEMDDIESFLVEHSLDGQNFEEVAKIEVTEKTNSALFSAEASNQQLRSQNGYYRLKAKDKKGKTAYTEIQYLPLARADKKDISVTIHPNDKYRKIKTLRFSEIEDYQMQVELTDHRGYRINSSTFEKGRNFITSTNLLLDKLELPKGIYNLVIYENNSKMVRKFIYNPDRS